MRDKAARMHFGCGCPVGGCEGRPQSVGVYGGAWSRCPIGVLESDPLFQRAIHLLACARVSPLVDWPTGYSAGCVSAIMAIQHERDAEEARQMRAASNGDQG